MGTGHVGYCTCPLQVLSTLGYDKLVVQLGRGVYIPSGEGVLQVDSASNPPVNNITDAKLVGLSIEWFRYKPSLTEDISSAELIISHGGMLTQHTLGMFVETCDWCII